MGDYDDLCSSSERDILNNPKLHESTSKNLDKYAESKVNDLCKELSFMKGRLIGLIGGNHFWNFPSGINSDQMMAQKLECKFLGVSSFIRLSIPVHGTHTETIDIWAHHGKGAGRLVGGSINTVEHMRDIGEADIYLMGHSHHKAAVTAGSKLFLKGYGKNMSVQYKKQWLVRTGSFLRGYVDGETSYVADAAMRPTDLGVIKIILTPYRDCKNGRDISGIDIHCLS
jgi:hypothetical protein